MVVRHRGWLFAFVAGLILCLLLLVVNLRNANLAPGTAWGVSYGLAGSGLLVGALLYTVRRRAPARGPGASSPWLQFHVYGGTLFLLLVLMHSGFRLPTGRLDWALWLLSIWVVVSGILGVAVQKWIPRILTSGLASEVHFDRIGELVDGLRNRSIEVAETGDAAIRDFFRQDLSPLMTAPRLRLIYFVDITGGIQSQIRRFRYLARILPAEEAGRLQELETLFVTKLELDAHYTLQKALRFWLYCHVPFSLLLVVLLGFHIFSVTYY